MLDIPRNRPFRGAEPWHVADEPVYHNSLACERGQAAGNARIRGQGGKPLCPRCRELMDRATRPVRPQGR